MVIYNHKQPDLGGNTLVMKLGRTQALSLAVVTGALSLAMQFFVPGIPLGVGKIDLALVPAMVGAVFAGPMAGVIIGFLHGIGSPAYIALIPSSIFSFTLLGYLAQRFKIKGGTALAIIIARVLIGTVVATIIFKPLVYPSVPLLTIYLIGLGYNIPSSIIAVFLCGLIEARFFRTLISSNQALETSAKSTKNNP
jgi:uncharacterized membrane protein